MSGNEELNNNVADVSSLINLYPKVENIPLLYDVAIGQEVSYAFEYLLHRYMRNDNKQSRRFGTYLCLIQADQHYFGNYIEKLLDFVNEDVINEVLMYIRSGIVPYHIWYEKLEEDLKVQDYYNKASVPGMLTVYLLKTLRCSLIGFMKTIKYLKEECNLPDELMRVIHAVEARYLETPKKMQRDYALAFSSETEEGRRKFMNNEISLFAEVLEGQLRYPLSIPKMEQLDELDKDDYRRYILPVWNNPLGGMSGGLVGTGSPVPANGVGGAEVQQGTEQENDTQSQEQQEQLDLGSGGMGVYAIDVLEYHKKNEDETSIDENAELTDEEVDKDSEKFFEEKGIKEHVISNKPVQYVLKKIAKDSSSRVMSETWFNTKEEALKFKKEIESSNPEITRNFNFVVEAGVRNA